MRRDAKAERETQARLADGESRAGEDAPSAKNGARRRERKRSGHPQALRRAQGPTTVAECRGRVTRAETIDCKWRIAFATRERLHFPD